MKKWIAMSIFAVLVLASCNLLQGDGQATATVAPVDALRTSAAKTVDALSTSLAINKTLAPTATGQGASHLWHTVQWSATSPNSSKCLRLTPRRVCSS